MRKAFLILAAGLTVFVLFATSLPAFSASGPIVMHEVKHDVSLPARDMGNNRNSSVRTSMDCSTLPARSKSRLVHNRQRTP